MNETDVISQAPVVKSTRRAGRPISNRAPAMMTQAPDAQGASVTARPISMRTRILLSQAISQVPLHTDLFYLPQEDIQASLREAAKQCASLSRQNREWKRLDVPEGHKMPDNLKLLVKIYKAQVRHYEAALLFRNAKTDDQRKEVKTTLRKWYQVLDSVIERRRGRPTLATFGTARNESITDEHVKLINLVAAQTATKGLDVDTGGGSGIMNLSGKAYIENGGFSQSVRLHFYKEDNPEPPSKFRTKELNCPPQVLFGTRTPLLFALEKVGYLFFPGGEGTVEELATGLLQRQLRDSVSTVFTGKTMEAIAPFILVDRKVDKDHYFWDSKLLEFHNKIKANTITPEKDTQKIFVIRIGEEEPQKYDAGLVQVKYFKTVEEAADFIVDLMWEQYKALAEFFEAERAKEKGAQKNTSQSHQAAI